METTSPGNALRRCEAGRLRNRPAGEGPFGAGEIHGEGVVFEKGSSAGFNRKDGSARYQPGAGLTFRRALRGVTQGANGSDEGHT